MDYGVRLCMGRFNAGREGKVNRAFRRLALRQKEYRDPVRVPIPALFDEFAVFDDIDRMLQKISHGEIEFCDGRPVMMAADGNYYEIVPALQGWISAWKAFIRKFSLDLDQDALIRLCNCLHYSVPIHRSLIKDAKAVVKDQRRLFRTIPRDLLASAARTEQIRLFLG